MGNFLKGNKALTSSSLNNWSEYMTDLFKLSGNLDLASFSFALALRESRKSTTIRTWTKIFLRKERSLIYL